LAKKKKKINGNQKGKRGEREVRDLHLKRGIYARRGQQYAGHPDAPDVVTALPYHVEVKYVENLNVHKALEQATHDSGRVEIPTPEKGIYELLKDMPVVYHRKRKEGWKVTVDAEDFLNLIEALIDKNI
jgi:hypothetical protein